MKTEWEMKERREVLVSVQWPRSKTEGQYLGVLHQWLPLSLSFSGLSGKNDYPLSAEECL